MKTIVVMVGTTLGFAACAKEETSSKRLNQKTDCPAIHPPTGRVHIVLNGRGGRPAPAEYEIVSAGTVIHSTCGRLASEEGFAVIRVESESSLLHLRVDDHFGRIGIKPERVPLVLRFGDECDHLETLALESFPTNWNDEPLGGCHGSVPATAFGFVLD